MLTPRDIDTAILVGGLGSRIRHIIGDSPKPLAVAIDEPFLFYLLDWLAKQGVSHVSLLAGYEASQIEEYAQSFTDIRLDVSVIVEICRLGTGGAVTNFLRTGESKKNVSVVMNGDSIAPDLNLQNLLSYFEAKDCDFLMVGRITNDTSRYGSLAVDGDMKLVGFKEKFPGQGYINLGLYIFRNDVLDEFLDVDGELSLERDIIPCLLERNLKINVVPYDGSFVDIGTEESLLKLNDFILKNLSED